jgi:hypothetical protein
MIHTKETADQKHNNEKICLWGWERVHGIVGHVSEYVRTGDSAALMVRFGDESRRLKVED